MTVRAAVLVAGSQLTNADAVYYTCPASTTAKIGRAVLSNSSGSAVTVTVNVVRSGGSLLTANQIINARSMFAGETYVSPELAGLVLNPGDTIHALCSANTSVTLFASGVTIT